MRRTHAGSVLFEEKNKKGIWYLLISTKKSTNQSCGTKNIDENGIYSILCT